MESTMLKFEVALAQTLDDRFASFVATHRDQAVRTAWRLTGADQSTAEEVAQDAFLKAHRSLHRFRDEASLSTWFYRILVRQASNHRRWRGVRDRFAIRFKSRNESPSTTTQSEPAIRASIQEAMNQLSTRQRSIFVLVYLEGHTLQESAQMVGCAAGTAKSHLHRALKHLRENLSEIHQEVNQ
jgi:RNA polymerase sigma-70 factor (ECF subfamily)